MTIDSTISEIDETTVSESELLSFVSEAQHYRVAFNLFREAAGYVCVLANTTVGQSSSWNTEQAVLGGIGPYVQADEIRNGRFHRTP